MNQEIKYRVVWGIGVYQDFTSSLDALIFKKGLDVPKSYPQPLILKFIDNKIVNHNYNADEEIRSVLQSINTQAG